MNQIVQPFQTWSSRAGQQLLIQLATKDINPSAVIKSHRLPAWETTLLRRALRAKEGFASTTIDERLRAQKRKSLSAILDQLRLDASHSPPLQSPQPAFRGNRSQLELLRRSVQVPTEDSEWNTWRRRNPRVIPDLRGADLSGLRLGNLRLSSARLSRANLSRALLGGATLDHADLRHARFFQANLYDANLRGADLRAAWFQDSLLTGAQLQGADLREATLIGCSLNTAHLEGADLRNAFLWGTSVWQVGTDSATRQADIGIGWDLFDPIDAAAFGLKRREASFNIRVDNIAVADFISLVSTNRKALANILDAASSKLVLLLGRFQGKQKEVLSGLESALSEIGYVPIVFNFREPNDRDLVETVAILAGLSRFVIADLTSPRSTPLESHLIIPNMAIPFVPILRGKEQPFSMFFALQRKYPWVLPPIAYTSEANLLRKLETKIVEPAEACARQLRRLKHPTTVNDR